MKCMGICIKKGEIRHAIIEGTKKNDCRIVTTGKHSFQASTKTPELMSFFHKLFSALFTQYNPDSVAYKLHLDSKLTQIPYMQYPFGILNYLCSEYSITSTPRSNSWIVAKERKKLRECSDFFGKSFNNEELQATLVAWHEFPD